MAGNPLAGPIDACSNAASTYTPGNAQAVLAWLAALPEFIDAASGMLSAQGRRIVEEFPINPAAGEAVATVGAQLARMRPVLEDVAMAFERAHHADLERLRNPRRNEHMWDVVSQDGPMA